MRFHAKQIAIGLIGLLAVGCATAPAPVNAASGAWRFNPNRCPDIIDGRHGRRDQRVTVCPASAWVWDGPHRYRTARPAAVTVYYNPTDRHYYRYGANKKRVRVMVR